MDKFWDVVCKTLKINRKDISLSSTSNDIPNWDSLNNVLLIAEIENEFDIEIPIEKIDNIKSLNDLYSLIESKK